MVVVAGVLLGAGLVVAAAGLKLSAAGLMAVTAEGLVASAGVDVCAKAVGAANANVRISIRVIFMIPYDGEGVTAKSSLWRASMDNGEATR